MKLFIEVEITPDEIPFCTELFRTLRTLTDHVKTRDNGKLFHAVISRLEDVSRLDSVASEISSILRENGMTEEVLDDLFGAFVAVVFNRDLVARQQSVVPFMFLLPRLPELAKAKLRDLLIPQVLKHLTIKRPVETSRMDFFAHAEAFAALVNMEFVSISGAVTTILTLLQKPENRCAAITMLGKTVELCLQQLTEKCDPSVLAKLNMALHSVTEDSFQYDISYIEESMGWIRQQPSGVSLDQAGASQADMKQGLSDLVSPSLGLSAVESYIGHRSTIFAMSFDEKRNQLVSSEKDGKLLVWGSDGQLLETEDLPRHYACSMDIHRSNQTLLICGVAKEETVNQRLPTAPCVIHYGAAGRGWKEHGVLSKESAKLISTIKAMPGAEHAFITGETHLAAANEGAGHKSLERLCYYDMQTSSSFATLQPVTQYVEHEDLITCLSLFPPNHNLFLSGSRDFSVRVWDRRTDRSVGMFGGTVKNGRVQGHSQMVTSLDASDTNMILSSGLDKRVLRWDFRALGDLGGSGLVHCLQLDNTAVLKVVIGNQNSAAVSTLRGLYLVDFSGAALAPRLAEPFSDGRRIGTYHDLMWAGGRRPDVLYAAGDEMRVDVYTMI